MPDVLDWRHVSPRDALVQAVQQLTAGRLVVFPTDTCYVACASAVVPDAVRRLTELPPADAEGILRVAVTGVEQARPWVGDLPTLGQRLARRLWPGPLILAVTVADKSSLPQSLPAEVAERIVRDGALQLQAPCHESIHQVLQLMNGPVVFRPLQRADGAEITSVEEITQVPPAGVDLIITDGNTYFDRPATTVTLTADGWKVTAAGVVTEDDLRRLSGCQIIFVCTGNTCRSPLAEALCKKLLADGLACTPEELPALGYVVQSAGLFAVPGHEASPVAVTVAHEFGADLASHRSQPLTGEMLLQADHVFTMTASHLDALAPHGLAMLGPPRLLSCEGEDVTDPIGAEPEVYRECAKQILHHLRGRLPEFRTH